jgi:hypothetical protein
MKKQPKAAAIRAEKATGKQPTEASQLPNLEDLVRFLASAGQDPTTQARALEQMIAAAAQQAKNLGVPLVQFLEMCTAARESIEPLDRNFQFGVPRQTRKR